MKCSAPIPCSVCDSECGEASAKLLETLHEGDLHLLPNLLCHLHPMNTIIPDQVDDTKCKTVFKNAFTTQMETQVTCWPGMRFLLPQCTPTFDTSCEPTIETAYRQQCKTIKVDLLNNLQFPSQLTPLAPM